MDSWTHAYRTTWENVPRASLGTSGGSLVLPTSLPFHVATRYRDPSWGVARLRPLLRCLRMTINRCRGLDSGSRNDFFGEVRGPTSWGRRTDSADFGESRELGRGEGLVPCGASVEFVAFVARLKPCPSNTLALGVCSASSEACA